MRLILLLVFSFIANLAWGLEIDEKLTIRLLRTSKTKKTILTNRGLEDGLVVGDHAKFFLTKGVVARGVMVKASPGRSVWSLYRLIDPVDVEDDKVMKIKISTPLKLSDDKTRVLNPDNSEERLVLTPGGLKEDLSEFEEGELRSIYQIDNTKRVVTVPRPETRTMVTGGKFPERNFELWGALHFSSLSSTSELNGVENTATSGSPDSIEFSLGGEYYFKDNGSFFSKFSIYGFYHQASETLDSTVSTSATITDSISTKELGLGVRYHFLSNPYSYQRLIAYVTGSLGFLGTVSGAGDEENGTFFSTTIGGGMKYYWKNGFGLHGQLDYHIRNEAYSFELTNSEIEIERSVSGVRAQASLAYRF